VQLTYLRELGKVVTGKLVVITPDRQETFLVNGKQPAYLPPQPSALPSGAYLTATTASSRAKGTSSSQKSLQVGGIGGTVKAAAQTADSSGGGSNVPIQQQEQPQQRSKVNYMKQNIKAAAACSSPKKGHSKVFKQ
jgi:hypothetical protein